MFIEPVFGKKFFGREEVLATLQKRVTSIRGGYRQNVALTGPMLTGKSSILRHFLMNIKTPDVVPLYIEMSGEDFNAFCVRFMASLLFQYLKSEELEAEGKFEALKRVCRKMIPVTVSHVDDICRLLKKNKDEETYEKLLELPFIFRNETGKSCIVILDEFHNLANFKLKKPFHTLGKFIMIQKNTMYIVSSSQRTLLKDILSKRLSLLFGNFEILEINGFDNQTARSFLTEKTKDIISAENIKNYIIQLSQGSPFYLEVLAEHFSEQVKARDGKKTEKECLLDAFAELLYDSNGLLNQYFMNSINFFLEKKSRKKFLPILVSLAAGNCTIKAIQKDLGRKSKDLGERLGMLQHMDLVYKSGVFYKISDKLFEFWLKNVYTLKTRSVVDDLDIKYLEFKSSLEKDYDEYCEFGSLSLTEVICDLFASFKNEKVQIRLNERRMPQFESVKSRYLSGNIFEVTGHAGGKAWACQVRFSGGRAGEQDIYSLIDVKSADDGNARITRKIFIPVKEIDHNAFLLAKEKNIWVWDVQQLNEILRLYGKHELVL
ncbi:MAG: ATP-binding protein [Candidatus Omnitrophota bacterium]